jgi:2'-5' RNA ligase
MQNPRYALVAYIRSPLGGFVENLRRELHPGLPHLAAHLTILPPRPLSRPENAALQTLENICGHAGPFEVYLGDVKTFVPVTSTVYIRVEQGADRMRELHDELNTEGLAFREEWPYIPHLTIVKLTAEEAAQNAFKTATALWASYTGTRRALLDRLTFVREDAQNCWVDVAAVPLGPKLAPR